MAHWFHISPMDLDDLTFGEVDELLDRLKRVPPIGGFMQYEPKSKKK